jgi:hypothetical protein
VDQARAEAEAAFHLLRIALPDRFEKSRVHGMTVCPSL